MTPVESSERNLGGKKFAFLLEKLTKKLCNGDSQECQDVKLTCKESGTEDVDDECIFCGQIGDECVNNNDCCGSASQCGDFVTSGVCTPAT